MHPAFDIERRPDQHKSSALSFWLELEANLPDTPFEFFAPDTPDISDVALEVQLKRTQYQYITASIRFQQARMEYGECLAKLARRNATRKRQANNQSIVFRLPNEIISFISQLIERPVLVSQICHRWRRIAIDTPALWCHFSGTTWNLDCPRTKTFYKRSRNHPLLFENCGLSGIVHLLPRIKVLDGYIQHPEDIALFSDIPAPLLESMSIKVVSYRDLQLFSILLFANNAPRLRRVQLETFFLTNFPTQSITEIALIRCLLPTPRETISFLQSIPTLRRLTLINNYCRDLGGESESPDCQLPSLRKLFISHAKQTGIKIITPNLEHLYLYTWRGVYPLIHHNSSLRHLWLIIKFFKEPMFRLIHEQLRDVQVLIIAAWYHNPLEQILSALSTEDWDGGFLFPSLRQLIIFRVDRNMVEQDFTAIQNLVQKRKQSLTPVIASVPTIKQPDFGGFMRLMPDLDELRSYHPLTQFS